MTSNTSILPIMIAIAGGIPLASGILNHDPFLITIGIVILAVPATIIELVRRKNDRNKNGKR